MNYKFEFIKNNNPKKKPNENELSFGELFTDHMFEMTYTPEKGWHDGVIKPYGPITLDPSTMVFHYGQEMFEGLKAYRTNSGEIALFRPEMNAKRTNETNARMCMPQIDPDLMISAIKELVKVDKDWIPRSEGTSLYIRPFIFATDPYLGVRPSSMYKFFIILCPVGTYYKGGLQPTKIYVEDEYVRAVAGGTGFAKVGGNYAASLKAQEKATAKGYTQVLWLDGVERKYVEEIGTSNAFFKINGTVYTSPLTGSILPGITRDSVITLLKHWGMKIEEKRLTIQEIFDAHEEGTLEEVFASGTAAVISPVGV
ncbi:MAG: branched-chain amino acid aminotransferase, partial [Peptostreptococcales bacterium]